MSSRRFYVFAAVVVFAGVSLAATNSDDPIIGYWRLVKSERNAPDNRPSAGELEMKFASGGSLMVKFRDQAGGTNAPRIAVGKFTLVPPDRITMSLYSTNEEHYRYLFKDGDLRMEHLDYPVTNTLKRLKEFSF